MLLYSLTSVYQCTTCFHRHPISCDYSKIGLEQEHRSCSLRFAAICDDRHIMRLFEYSTFNLHAVFRSSLSCVAVVHECGERRTACMFNWWTVLEATMWRPDPMR